MDLVDEFHWMFPPDDILFICTAQAPQRPKKRGQRCRGDRRRHSLPGEGGYDEKGVSYFFCNQEKTELLLNEKFGKNLHMQPSLSVEIGYVHYSTERQMKQRTG